MKIVTVTQKDRSYISEIAKLESEIFPDPWSEKSIRETLENQQARIFAAVSDGTKSSETKTSVENEMPQRHILGYVIIYYVMDEGEIARIATGPDWRRKGVAAQLLGEIGEFGRQQGILRWLLDVRESNASAICFYEKSGFSQDGMRKNFYANPTENAILMSCEADKIIYR